MHNSFSSNTLPARHQPLPPRSARTSPAPTPGRTPEEATDTTKGSRRAAGTPNPDTLDAELAQLEGTRLAQLHAIDENVRDAITAAYRDSVLRALGNIRTARERLAAGTYGLCTWCTKAIPPERLELIPSAPMCVPCTVHTRAG
jgi:DnaK suppressor protein